MVCAHPASDPRGRAGGAGVLSGPYGPHVRRGNPRSRFGAREAARSADRPGHDRRVAVSGRTHRPGPLLDVVVETRSCVTPGPAADTPGASHALRTLNVRIEYDHPIRSAITGAGIRGTAD